MSKKRVNAEKGKKGFQPTVHTPVEPKMRNHPSTPPTSTAVVNQQQNILLTYEKTTNLTHHPEEQPVRTVEEDGTIRWTLDGKLHNPNGPALQYPNGRKEWWKHGKRDHPDGPAVEEGEYKEWWREGQRDRPDGPAIEAIAFNAWFEKDKRNRLDGAAIEWADETKRWWVNNQTTNHPDLCEKATLPNLTDEEFHELCTHEDYVVRQLAAHNPHCPPRIVKLADNNIHANS